MNRLEQMRLHVLNAVLERQLPAAQASEILGVSGRNAWRLLASYRREGAPALARGNRGRKPRNAVPGDAANAVVQLTSTTYSGAYHTHLAELLRDREGIDLNRPTVHRILTRAGIPARTTGVRPSTKCEGNERPRLGCCRRWTPVSTSGWAMMVLNSPCSWWWTTPPAPRSTRCSVPRRTPAVN